MGSLNRRFVNLSPWVHAAFWASVIAFGGVSGRVLYGWVAGAVRLVEVLAIGGFTGVLVFPVARLTAPATLQAMRQHQLWREKRRQQRSPWQEETRHTR